MTQEDKELLLIDLSGRVRYGVRLWLKYFEKKPKYFIDGHNILGSVIYDKDSECKISLIDKGEYDIEGHRFSNYEQVIKPYLRPMSSMTVEEECEFCRLFECDSVNAMYEYIHWTVGGSCDYYDFDIEFSKLAKLIDCLNSHHFDYRGLIEKGLALEAPEGMYK